MEIALYWLAASSLLELALWLPAVWKLRRILLWPLMLAVTATSIWLLATTLSIWTVCLALLSVYRILNYARIHTARMHNRYLYRATQLTSLILIGLQVSVVGLALLNRNQDLNPMVWWYVLAGLQLIATGVLLLITVRNMRSVQAVIESPSLADKELPTLTVSIPARNETKELEACLTSLLASNYPKLEILVLDDCSQNKRTPEIIRSFAQSGVRFIAGSAPPEQWLAKNYAYQQLAEAANGELLLFCGVDTTFTPETLRQLVCHMQQKQLAMLSLMPRNRQAGGFLSYIVQPTRYAWELTLPRRLMRRPPVLSTCWLITAKTLQKSGGFAAVRRKPVPESYLSRFAMQNGKYQFLACDSLTSQKDLSEQRETAIRTRYPQLHRRPELVVVVSVVVFIMFVWPLILLPVAAFSTHWALVTMSALSLVFAGLLFGQITTLTFRHPKLITYLLAPTAALYDILLLNRSMWLYEFREVMWKGRNVCLPVMHAPVQDSAQK